MTIKAFMLALLCATPLAAQAPAPAKPPAGQGTDGDWAYLARYRDANAALPAASARRVAFMGDSITEGWARQPGFGQGADFVGRGISGQTTPQMLVRFHDDAIALHPRVIHIMGGTNDVAGNTGMETDAQIEGYITAMVELARAHRITVVLASIPPAADFPWRPTPGVVPRIERLNRWIKAYAARERLTYVDYWPALATPEGAMKPEYSGDGVHPNAAGYAAMAPLARAAIEHALRAR